MLPRMDIVQDTNVFIAGVLSGSGAAARCLDRCITRRDTPHFGAALLAEHEAKVADDAIWARYGITRAERRALLADLVGAARWTSVWFTWRPNLPDPADDHVYELALAAHAEHLVTANTKDFRRADLKPFERPRIVTPAEHLENV